MNLSGNVKLKIEFNHMQTQLKTEIQSDSLESIQLAAHLLQAGQVVGMPTETVYGLAASLWQEEGLTRIFASKERPHFDPLIVHLSSEMASDQNFMAQLVDFEAMSTHWRNQFKLLSAHFWAGPLTLVLPKTNQVPDLATSGLPTIALRVPNHPVAQALIKATGAPLAAPSANRFGRISPTSAQDVFAELAGRIPLILDGGPCEVGLESTVLSWSEAETPQILRPGQISALEISKVLGLDVQAANLHPAEIQAPGMLKNHYAPRKPLFLLPSGWQPGQKLIAPFSGQAAFLLLAGNATQLSQTLSSPVITLSPEGERKTCARHLFAALRCLDESETDYIWAELPTDSVGLGHAIANRLCKAAGV
jgi:L-threonylcarbamoyladenylate synthase